MQPLQLLASSLCSIKLCKCAGDAVAEDDLLVQIETDKVTIDVRYQQKEPGVVKEFLVKMDDTVQVRAALGVELQPWALPSMAVLPYLGHLSWFNRRSSIGFTNASICQWV